MGKVPWLVALELTAAKGLGDTGKYRIDTLKFFVFFCKIPSSTCKHTTTKISSFACRRRRRHLAITIARHSIATIARLLQLAWPSDVSSSMPPTATRHR